MQQNQTRKKSARRSAGPKPPAGKSTTGQGLLRRRSWKRPAAVLFGLALVGLVVMFAGPARRKSSPPVMRCEVLAAYPHASDAFSQGLVFHEGALYEGTGGYGASSLREVDLTTGRIAQQHDLDPRYFGEGIALVGDEIFQVTWRSRVGFVYDKQTLQPRREFRYAGEGWGLAYDGRHLVMSDGTDTLRFFEPNTFREVRRVQVTSGGRRLYKLNELEYADGFLYANIWHSDYIVKISPQTGDVVAWIDLRGLLPPDPSRGAESVLNGIAHDPATGRFFVTGKNWPSLFEVRFLDAAEKSAP